MSSSSDTESDTSSLAPTTIVFHPYGDTRLLASAEGSEKIFVVSSMAMMQVCDPWRCMLAPDGRFREARPLADGMKEIKFPEDDGTALAILLNIAHSRFHKVPKTLSLSVLLEVAILTDKYGATALVEPWIGKWLRDAKRADSGHSPQEWLFVGWAFGETQAFEASCWNPMKGIRLKRNGTYSGLDDYLPPGIAESIIETRKHVIEDLLKLLYKYVDKYGKIPYLRRPVCGRCGADSAVCTALRALGFNEARETVKTMRWSISTLMDKLTSLQLPDFPSGPILTAAIRAQFWYSLMEILNNIPSPALKPHYVHMRRQRAILHGYTPSGDEDFEAHELDIDDSD